jgi:peroxiredoxin
MEAQASLLNTIEERDFPDIIADDMYGNPAKLSELEGNVILVDFWAAELGNSNALNADLKQIYNKYEDKGFRVYQVSFDTSKATWIKAVQEQKLPWVSVCDFRGQASPIMGVYNVRSLPSNYLIDRNGHIVAKNVYSDALERELKKIL